MLNSMVSHGSGPHHPALSPNTRNRALRILVCPLKKRESAPLHMVQSQQQVPEDLRRIELMGTVVIVVVVCILQELIQIGKDRVVRWPQFGEVRVIRIPTAGKAARS